MRNYWLRILFGSVAIFAVGMVGVTLARQGMRHVKGVVEGSGPISVPVPFLPFRLDGERIGTVQRIRINRAAPKQISSVNIRVRLADSISPSRLEGCILVADNFEQLNDETTFLCSTPEDTAGEDLRVVGDVTLAHSGRSFRLLMPQSAIQELTDSEVVFVGEDSAALSHQQHDSIAQAAERMTDSILEAKRPQLESLGVNIPRRPSGARRPGRGVADSAQRR